MTTTTRSHAPSSDRYFVKYQVQMGSTEAERNTLADENDRGTAMPLDHIRDVCRACDTNAELFDLAGFRKGWVHDDGGYTLT